MLLHFKKPQKHFTLFIGSYGQYIFLSDPSIGVHFIDNKEFDSKFSGYALFIHGKDELLLFSIIPQIAASYYFPALFNKEGDFTQSYSIQCKLNLTIVFNNIISTSISITPYFTIPEIREFEGFVDRQLEFI